MPLGPDWRHPPLFVRQRSNVVDQVPEFSWLDTVTFRRHLAPAILDDVKQFSVGHALQRSRVSIIFELQLLILGDVTLAITVLAMAHGAIVPIIFLPLCDGLGGWFHRIDL